MVRPYDIVTFDCYGTLIDWRAGIGEAFERRAARDGVSVDRARVLELHAEVEPAVQAQRFRPYREVLAETATRIAERLDWPLAPGGGAFLPDSLPDWPPFPDTDRALRRLREAGFALGILSNIDDDLIAATLSRFEAGFELLVTAERVRSYKPALPHFEAAREAIGARRWLHAAQSHFHDVRPACRMGVPVAWVNRLAESPPAPADPVRTVPDLDGLARWLAPDSPG